MPGQFVTVGRGVGSVNQRRLHSLTEAMARLETDTSSVSTAAASAAQHTTAAGDAAARDPAGRLISDIHMWCVVDSPAGRASLGLYFGTWGAPDFIHRHAAAVTVSAVKASSVEEAQEILIHYGAPTVFRGPVPLEPLVVGAQMVDDDAHARLVEHTPVPMGAPVQLPPPGPELESLTPTSPMKDFHTFSALSVRQPEVGQVKITTGGHQHRSRMTILSELRLACAAYDSRLRREADAAQRAAGGLPASAAARPHSPPQVWSAYLRGRDDSDGYSSPGYSSSDDGGDGAVPSAPLPTAAPPQAPAAVPPRPPLSPVPPPPPLPALPPIALQHAWEHRAALRSAVADVYRWSAFLPGLPCAPPDTGPHAGGRRAAFVDSESGVEHGRGPTGRVALYIRNYLIGGHEHAAARARMPPRPDMRGYMSTLASCCLTVRDHVATHGRDDHDVHADQAPRPAPAVSADAAAVPNVPASPAPAPPDSPALPSPAPATRPRRAPAAKAQPCRSRATGDP